MQTVLRRFGNRAGLVDAAFLHAFADVQTERQTPVGDVRRFHREWVEAAFAPYLPDGRARRDDLLVVVTDVYIWKLLRRDRGLDRAATQERMHQLVAALIEQE